MLVGGAGRRRGGRHHADQQPQPGRIPGREAAHGRRRRGGQGVHRPRGGRVARRCHRRARCLRGGRPHDPVPRHLEGRVDVEAIRNANLRVVVDPLYGAGRIYLAQLLRDLGVEVCEINNAEDPTFDGLHFEPIPPWVTADREGSCWARHGFINDGDADCIGAVDERGNFVNSPQHHAVASHSPGQGPPVASCTSRVGHAGSPVVRRA
ncbi:MAG: hypothetical protein ACLUVF_09980 [Adlercreutzia sp.]